MEWENLKKLGWVFFAIALILNFSNFLMTVYGVSSGLFIEANPLMRYLLAISPVVTFFVLCFIYLLFYSLKKTHDHLWTRRLQKSASRLGDFGCVVGLLSLPLLMVGAFGIDFFRNILLLIFFEAPTLEPYLAVCQFFWTAFEVFL